MGRPTVITQEALRKLEEAFSNGATDLEACFLANISKSALYDYQKENPEFVERKEGLKSMLKYQARINIAKEINSGDARVSAWYLERKAKSEFSSRVIDNNTASQEEQVPLLELLQLPKEVKEMFGLAHPIYAGQSVETLPQNNNQ